MHDAAPNCWNVVMNIHLCTAGGAYRNDSRVSKQAGAFIGLVPFVLVYKILVIFNKVIFRQHR